MESVDYNDPDGVKCPNCSSENFTILNWIADQGRPFNEALCNDCQTRFKIMGEPET